jgi:hypothetical protein
MYPVSQRFKETFYRTHKRIVVVNVCNFDGSVVQQLRTVVDGNVTVDETQATRRTLSLTIESQGHNLDNLIPRIKTDLLNPAASHEIRVYRGIDYQDGTTEVVPLGVFQMSKPQVTEKTAKSGDVSFEIVVTGYDRSSWLARLPWITPYTIVQGTTLSAAVIAAVQNRMASVGATLRMKIVNTPNTFVQYTTWGLSTGSADNPWTDLTKLVSGFGYELFFDVEGTLVMQAIASSDKLQPANVAQFEEGVNCTTTAIQLTLDVTKEYSGVIVIARGKGIAVPPVRAEAWDTNINSPTYYLGPFGKVPYIFVTHAFPTFGQTNAQAVATAQLVAQAQLQRLLQQMNAISLSAIPNPMIQEGDVITVARSAMGIQSGTKYIVSTMTIPLDTMTEMVITNRPQTVGTG